MTTPSLAQLEAAAELVHAVLPPTPQILWPLLSERAGAEAWVKHENQTVVGAFKVRGGLVYLDRLRRAEPGVAGVVTASTGNHGQSVAFAARRHGLRVTIVVPEGNSRDKNAAMRALGATLVEHGADFQAAHEEARRLSEREGLHRVPSFHPDLILGVASYSLEFLRGAPPIDTVYVPIGLGSGISGMIAVRDALGLGTRVVGVVAAGAPAYALSFQQRTAVSTESVTTIADGMACRVPDPVALDIILRGADRVVTVTDAEIRAAMRHYFRDTHNLAEGAGAAGLAGLLQEREQLRGKRVGLVLSGGNIDAKLYGEVLTERT